MPAALLPQSWPFGLEWLPPAAYLVGGSVRDALLGRQADYLDLDFVLPEGAVQTAKRIANHYQAGYVLLDAERQIARVVFAAATVDFAAQVGSSLEEDLRRRDFTINAIAYSPHSQQILDPLQGYADLQRRLIRTVQFENLKEDPLRLLRAYRQAAQLGFSIEPDTRHQICRLADLLEPIAAERIQSELGYLLSNASPACLKLAWQDGLLAGWLPHITAQSFEQIERMDQAAAGLRPNLDLGGVRTDSRDWLKLAKLSALLSADPAIAELELWRLKYSRAEIQATLAVVTLLPRLQGASSQALSASEQYYLFRQVGTAFPALAVAGLALAPLATVALIQRYLTASDPVAHPVTLLTGRDLMALLQLQPSPMIGQLLEAIQLAQAEGNVTNRAEALAFARGLL